VIYRRVRGSLHAGEAIDRVNVLQGMRDTTFSRQRSAVRDYEERCQVESVWPTLHEHP
jgi:hypothetical protein